MTDEEIEREAEEIISEWAASAAQDLPLNEEFPLAERIAALCIRVRDAQRKDDAVKCLEATVDSKDGRRCAAAISGHDRRDWEDWNMEQIIAAISQRVNSRRRWLIGEKG